MPRIPRSLHQFGWFHVTNRGVDRFDIFETPLDRVDLEYEIEVAAARFGVEVHAYCWMNSHFHLVIYCRDGHLSDFVRQFCREYVIKHNRAIDREGPLFTGRFVSVPLGLDDSDPDASFKQAVRYVHRNPLDFVPLPMLAGFADSSYGAYLGIRRPPTWLRTELLLEMCDGDTKRLRTFTEEPHPSDSTPAKGRSIDPVSADRILLTVAEVTGKHHSDIVVCAPRTRNDARALAALLAVESRADCAEVAELLGFAERRSLYKLAARGKARRSTDMAFAELHRRALTRLRRNDLDIAA